MLKAPRDRNGLLRCGVPSVVLLNAVLLNASIALGQTTSAPPASAAATNQTTANGKTAPAAAATAMDASHASAPVAAPAPIQSGALQPGAAPAAAPMTGFAAQQAENDDAASVSPATHEPPKKPPPSTRWLLMGVGVGTTAAWYAAALGIRELWPSQAHRTDLQYPIAGPFMDLAHTGCPSWNTGCSKFQLVVRTLLVTLDAIGQAGGVALVLEGAVLSTSSGESPPSATTRLSQRRRPERTVSAVPMPWFDQTGGGIGLVGQF